MIIHLSNSQSQQEPLNHWSTDKIEMNNLITAQEISLWTGRTSTASTGILTAPINLPVEDLAIFIRWLRGRRIHLISQWKTQSLIFLNMVIIMSKLTKVRMNWSGGVSMQKWIIIIQNWLKNKLKIKILKIYRKTKEGKGLRMII